MRRRSFPQETVESLRLMHVCAALSRLGLHWKRDPHFRPRQDPRTIRLHVSLPDGRVLELLATGTKFYDPQAQRGGGGAVDLAMHLLGLPFVDAVRRLQPLHDHERSFDATTRSNR